MVENFFILFFKLFLELEKFFFSGFQLLLHHFWSSLQILFSQTLHLFLISLFPQNLIFSFLVLNLFLEFEHFLLQRILLFLANFELMAYFLPFQIFQGILFLIFKKLTSFYSSFIFQLFNLLFWSSLLLLPYFQLLLQIFILIFSSFDLPLQFSFFFSLLLALIVHSFISFIQIFHFSF